MIKDCLANAKHALWSSSFIAAGLTAAAQDFFWHKRRTVASMRRKPFNPPDSDRLFRAAIAIPLLARQFLSAWWPREFLALVDWETLEIRRITGIDESLTARPEDVIYSIRAAGRQVCFYVLIEHQSQPDKLMTFRIVKYTILTWRDHLKKTTSASRPLPLVVPLSFTQAQRTGRAHVN